jgi:hypothetical protein
MIFNEAKETQKNIFCNFWSIQNEDWKSLNLSYFIFPKFENGKAGQDHA